MTLRLSTTLDTFSSDVWSPTATSIFQIKAEDPRAKVNLMAKVHTDAPWARVEELYPHRGFYQIPVFPFMRLDIVQNTAGKSVNVWDDAA